MLNNNKILINKVWIPNMTYLYQKKIKKKLIKNIL